MDAIDPSAEPRIPALAQADEEPLERGSESEIPLFVDEEETSAGGVEGPLEDGGPSSEPETALFIAEEAATTPLETLPAEIGAAPEGETPPLFTDSEVSAETEFAWGAAPAEQEEGEEARAGAEILQILYAEIEQSRADLQAAAEQLLQPTATSITPQTFVREYQEELERIIKAAEMVGLAGLRALVTHLLAELDTLLQREQQDRIQMQDYLRRWPARILEYLRQPESGAAITALIEPLTAGYWSQPLSADQAQQLTTQLAQGATAVIAFAQQAPAPTRATQVSPEDVSLALPEDLNPEIFDTFLQETPARVAEFSACLQVLVTQGGQERLDAARRIAHTIKGGASVVGIHGIVNLTHALEDIFEGLGKRSAAVPPELGQILLEGADCLESMVEALQGTEAPPAEAQPLLAQVLQWANRVERGELAADVSPPEGVPSQAEEAALPPVAASASAESETATLAPAAPAELAATPVLRVPARSIDRLLANVSEMAIALDQAQARLQRCIEQSQTRWQQDQLVNERSSDLEVLVEVRGLAATPPVSLAGPGAREEFDTLEMDRYNELHSQLRALHEAFTDAHELGTTLNDELASVRALLMQVTGFNKAFQETVMSTRMVAVRSIAARLHRAVRQACRATGKEAALRIEGEEILMDSDILQRLVDPLLHLLRNAVDHGIESLELRRQRGKPEQGRIELRFRGEGTNIWISCWDNGGGLDYAAIREQAVRRGLIPPTQQPSESELARVIFAPGFTTRAQATAISGRGVGLDVVYQQIIDLKGTLEVTSQGGAYTQFSIRVPTSLINTRALLIEVNEEPFAVPGTVLEQILTPGSGEYQEIAGKLSYHWRHNAYPVSPLAALLHRPYAPVTAGTEDPRSVLLVRAEAAVYAVPVDGVRDSRDLVIKDLGHYLQRVRGVSGASILGDGRVVPILDLPELLRVPLTGTQLGRVNAEVMEPPPVIPSLPRALIVEDSLSVRRALASLLEDSYEVMAARDGLEALERIAEQRPDILLVDLEMPRMDGIELTRWVRTNATTQDVPVIMITSRSMEKHRQLAQQAGVNRYFVKPYGEQQLLDEMANLVVSA